MTLTMTKIFITPGYHQYNNDTILGMTNAEVLHQVEHGYRMASPQNCPPALYDIMLECWHKVFSIIQRSNILQI